jgi:hypothetical protein
MNTHPKNNKDSLGSVVLSGNSPDADPSGSVVRPLAAFKVGTRPYTRLVGVFYLPAFGIN